MTCYAACERHGQPAGQHECSEVQGLSSAPEDGVQVRLGCRRVADDAAPGAHPLRLAADHVTPPELLQPQASRPCA